MVHAHCVFLCLPRHLHSLPFPDLRLSDYLVLPSARQLHLPGRGGHIPCATPLRTLAPWPRTSLPQVMSPTTTSSRRLMSNTHRNPPASSALLDACRRRADHPVEKGMSSCLSSSVGHRTERPVVDQFDTQISNVRKNPRRSSESEQIRLLLERQREQILAD